MDGILLRSEEQIITTLLAQFFCWIEHKLTVTPTIQQKKTSINDMLFNGAGKHMQFAEEGK